MQLQLNLATFLLLHSSAMQLVAALQGLVNRATPMLYIFFTDAYNDWFTYLRQPEQYLANTTVLRTPSYLVLTPS